MLRTRRGLVAFLLASFVVILSAVLFACSQTPTSVPIRTFERAQKVDAICLRVFGEKPEVPTPLKQEECAPVPPEVNGGSLRNHLFALVTQTTRGEVAVVDLSAGGIIDQRHAIPGLNFLPVGANPTDIASTPDGRMVFVSSAEPNKFAIYGIPGRRILGEQAEVPDPDGPVTLASWPVCSLPQRPGSLTVVPRRATPGVVTDAGTSAGEVAVDYELVAVLPGDRSHSTKVVTLDPKAFLRGSPGTEKFGAGDIYAPGKLQPCVTTSAIELSGEEAVPATFRSGHAWSDGVPWVDGGVDLTCERPSTFSSCGQRPCKCTSSDPVDPDAGTPTDCSPDAGRSEPEEYVLDLGPLDPPRGTTIARDDQTLYIADEGVPLIHVIDLSTPGAPRELPPFVATSVVDPTRAVTIRALAVSPPTHEFKRFLYAIEREEGSIMVFDVTDPATAERTPMVRPHPELNPFQAPDRIGFSSPIVAVSFARHDVPVQNVVNPKTGVLCNPNPNATDANGAQYRADSQNVNYALGPRPSPGRLRGIFAFATLSNGAIVAIDVDDWDAPCRRPVDLSKSGVPGVLAVAQTPPVAGDVDPYHAPTLSVAPGSPTWVSGEAYFPVSAPHRLRSNYFFRAEESHTPTLASNPTITSKGATQPPLTGQGSEATPRLRLTRLAGGPELIVPPKDEPPADKAAREEVAKRVGVSFSLDTPEVHSDQDWTVVYEGKLPNIEFPGTLATNDNYATLVLSQSQARFCAKGVEDWAIGKERAAAIVSALAKIPREYAEPLDQRMADYVQVADELPPASDPWWQPRQNEDACWDIVPEQTASARFDLCSNYFGTAGEESPNRDFPILEAYDDHLVLGGFSDSSPSRRVVGGGASLKALQCCFRRQVKFNVRTGAQWLASGSVHQTLSHMTPGAGGRCVASCESNVALLNSRAPAVPYGIEDFAPYRDSALAMRNPMFSFFVQNGFDKDPQGKPVDRRPERDMTYRFSTRGGFVALSINLAGQTVSVTPQSMKFIESLGQIAVVDGASQGLVLIDLAGVGIARAPYF